MRAVPFSVESTSEICGGCRLECYDTEYLTLDTGFVCVCAVLFRVESTSAAGAVRALLEYSDTEYRGAVMTKELSRRQMSSVSKLLKVGQEEVHTLQSVDGFDGFDGFDCSWDLLYGATVLWRLPRHTWSVAA